MRRTIPHAAITRLSIGFFISSALAVVAGQSSQPAGSSRPTGLRIGLSFPAAQSASPIDGRMLLLLSTHDRTEPRFQMSIDDGTAQLFGVDVEGLNPGEGAWVDASVLGYPMESLSGIKPGDYWVQGLLHVYETFKRSDGHTVKLPMDRGEGQQWNAAPGNFYSAPQKIRIDPSSGSPIRISLDRRIPPLPDVPDTKYVKHIRMQSERLTKFWGRPMYLGAIVILPEGYDSHPSVRYPLAIYHGHFERNLFGWRETPPDDTLPQPDVEGITKFCPNGHEGELCTKYGYERMVQDYGYKFFKEWTGAGFPRVILMAVQHANPYYDDSYAVNSANLGPYGDAITYELVPYIEKMFRGIGPWARGLYGGSTGGWEALGAQVMYPDEFNGTYANCPDPIDFGMYTVVNLYEDENAYYSEGSWKTTPRPAQRDYLGRTRSTLDQANRFELVLGTKSRSGQQWDIWEAVYSPVAADGYPQRIWDKRTGVIDKKVAKHWRDHYDLGHIMQRDWPTLGPKLRGKITINVGLSDNFFLNNAVYLVEDRLKAVTNPPADAKFDYGLRDEHCWSGDHDNPNAISRITYHSRFIRGLAEHWTKTAPKGADTTGWRY